MVRKSNSLQQSELENHNEIANIFVNNQNPYGACGYRDQWFRGSGTELDKSLNNMMGVTFQGNSSYTDLFGKREN